MALLVVEVESSEVQGNFLGPEWSQRRVPFDSGACNRRAAMVIRTLLFHRNGQKKHTNAYLTYVTVFLVLCTAHLVWPQPLRAPSDITGVGRMPLGAPSPRAQVWPILSCLLMGYP